MSKFKVFALILLFSLGFLVRLYRLSNPVADWHSFRQSDTAAVAQIYVTEGYDLLLPKYFDISKIQSGSDNPMGYRFVEFPIYNFLHAFFYKTVGVLSFVEWGRMVSIVSSLISAAAVYLIVKKYANIWAAFASTGAFLFLPFSIFYSRTILPDTIMTTSILVGILFFDLWISQSNKKSKRQKNDKIISLAFFLLSAFFTAVAFLLKPFALFFAFPIIYLAYKNYGYRIFIKWQLYVFAILTIIPLVLWRLWISQFPEGIPASSWLFNGNEIRFRPAFFRWIFYERITKLFMGYLGVIFLAVGAFKIFENKKGVGLFLSLALSSTLYLFVVATGNVQHDYYQILIVPTISMFTGIGIVELFRLIRSKTNVFIGAMISCLIVLASVYFSWNLVRDYFNINDWGMVKAGERASVILPKDAIVIAPYDGSTTLLNITSRRGWPVFQNSVEELIERGAEYMVIANPTSNDFSGFGKQFEIVESSNTYLILKLDEK